MLPNLDISTVTFISSLYCYLFAIALLLLTRKNNNYYGLYSLALADIFIASSFLLLSFRASINSGLSIFIANAMLHIGFILSHKAITQFRNIKTGKRFYFAYVIFLVQSILFIYFIYFKPDVNARIIVISFAMALQCLLMWFSLIKFSNTELTSSETFINHLILFQFIVFSIRGFTTFTEQPLESFISAGFIHSVSICSILIFVITKDFAIILTMMEKIMLKLIHTARIDSLTQVYNRRGLDELATREFNKLLRQNQDLCLVICDLDDFKSINDNYGHSMGDRALINFAQILKANTRNIDICARSGGDEFVIIFPNTSTEQCSAIINKVKHQLEHNPIDDNKKITLSASFGIASYEPGMNYEQLTTMADQALYRVKRNKNNSLG